MQKFGAIESLRGYMAWWVVLAHALNILGAPSAEGLVGRALGTLQSADIAVNVFIIISGFVITHLILSREEPYRPYIARRFFRIFPIYIVAIFIALALTDLYRAVWIDLPWATSPEARIDRLQSQWDFFVQHALLHVSMLHGVVPNNVLPFSESAFLSTAWSLSLEWQFYLIAPTLIWFARRSSPALLMTVVAMMLIGLVSQNLMGSSFVYKSFLPLALPYFALGIASRLALPAVGSRPAVVPVLASILPLIFVGPLEALIWFTFLALSLSEARYLHLPAAIQGAANVLVFNDLVANVGKWSYSTYLLHIPIFTLLVGGYVRIVGPNAASWPVVALIVCLGAAVTLGVSWLSFRLIETPGSRLSSGFGPARAPLS